MTDVSLKYLVLPRVELGVWSHTWGCRSCLCRGHAIGHMKFWLISLRTASALWLYLSIDCRCHKNSRKNKKNTTAWKWRERRTENGKTENCGISRVGPYANQDMPHTHHFVSLTALNGTYSKLVKTCSFSNFFSQHFFYFFSREQTKNWQRILPFVVWQAALAPLAALAIAELIFAYFW